MKYSFFHINLSLHFQLKYIIQQPWLHISGDICVLWYFPKIITILTVFSCSYLQSLKEYRITYHWPCFLLIILKNKLKIILNLVTVK